MVVKVRLFASLRESLGFGERTIEADTALTAAEVWSRIADGGVLPSQVRVAINARYAKPADPVRDGDEVAFCPPVTGG